MEKLGRAVEQLRRGEWRLPPHYVVLFALLLVAIGMRLPYFFLSNDLRLWRYEMLYHDEALFIMHGRDVLNGRLPYITHWDNRPPFGWGLFAIMNLLSGENLVAFRVLGALVIGLTGYVLYRALADRQKAVAGMLAGVFYIIFCSVAQISQSVTYEHLASLPQACMLYLVLNPQSGKYHRLHIMLLFAMCVLTLTNFIMVGPALALLLPGRVGKRDVSVPPAFTALRTWAREMVQWGMFVVRNGITLLVTVLICYSCIYTIYWINGEGDFLLRSLIDGAFTVSRQPMDARLVTQVVGRWESFSEKFLNSYVYSNEWLIPFMLSVFLCRVGGTVFEARAKRDTVLITLLVLLCGGAMALFFRGGNFWNFPYYLLQIMPIVAMAMGCAMAFRMGDARLVMMLAILWGLNDATRIVFGAYRPFIAYMKGDNKYSYIFMNDRQYQVARELNRFPIAGQSMYVCNEDNMLYILTHTENPRYFIFPAFTRFAWLAKVLGVELETTQKTVKASHPVAIVGWRGDACFSSLGDEAPNYALYTSIMNTVVYMRKDMLQQLKAVSVPEENPQAP